MSSMIELNAMKFERNQWTLQIPEWTLRPGEVVGLVGPVSLMGLLSD